MSDYAGTQAEVQACRLRRSDSKAGELSEHERRQPSHRFVDDDFRDTVGKEGLRSHVARLIDVVHNHKSVLHVTHDFGGEETQSAGRRYLFDE